MNFFYNLTNAQNGLTGMESSISFFPNFSSFLPQNEQFLNPSFYPVVWHQEVICNNEVLRTSATTSGLSQDRVTIPSQSISSSRKKKTGKAHERKIISAKKNSQSNIINQLFCFLGSREKSYKIVEKCCHLLKKNSLDIKKVLDIFYSTIKFINDKRGRKYVNSAMLVKLFTPQEFKAFLPEIQDKIVIRKCISLWDLCQILRRCTSYFLNNISPSAIMTSKRISLISKKEHFVKRRKVLRSILQI